jgi:hypothetical protein
MATPANLQPIYRPRGPDPLRTLFRRRFPDFQAAYEQRYASKYGKYRLPLITRAASAFRVCGDWSQGIARIRCPSCGFDRFRPFSCKSYFLCPSCAQKRTLLVGEYLSEDLLLTLPHRQFVWTIPKRRLRPARHLLLHTPGSHRGPHRDLAPQRRRPVPREGSAESRLRPQDPRLAARRLFNREWDSNPRPAHARGSVPVPREGTSFPAAHPLGRAAGHRHLVRFPLGVLQGQDPPLLLPGLHRPGDVARSPSGEAPCAPLRPLLLAGARNVEGSSGSALARSRELVRPQRHGRVSASGCPEGPCLGRGSTPPGRRDLPTKSLGPTAGQGPRDRRSGLPSMWIPYVSHRRHYGPRPDTQDHRLPRASRPGPPSSGISRQSATRLSSPGSIAMAAARPPRHARGSHGRRSPSPRMIHVADRDDSGVTSQP